MKCKECCGDGYNLRIVKKGNGYTTERVTCEHCNGTGEVQMTEPKLKPCPFCGCEASTWKAFSTNDWRAFCTNSQSCGAMIRGGNTEQEIIEAWNRRVGEVEK